MSRAIKFDNDEFRRLWISGVPTGKIAARFGASKSTISLHVKRLGLKPRPNGRQAPMVIDDTPAFREAWASKLSYAEIGDALGCSADTVKRAGIKFCYPKRNLRSAPAPQAEPKLREGVRRVAVKTIQSSINEVAVSHVSLAQEPWVHDSEATSPQGCLT